jgi:two-component system, OmpR family, KDP operon response regulator KdpE
VRTPAVATASTGADGLRVALDERPDLVVLDLGRPNLDGLELLRMLRAVSRVSVIVATRTHSHGKLTYAVRGSIHSGMTSDHAVPLAAAWA